MKNHGAFNAGIDVLACRHDAALFDHVDERFITDRFISIGYEIGRLTRDHGTESGAWCDNFSCAWTLCSDTVGDGWPQAIAKNAR